MTDRRVPMMASATQRRHAARHKMFEPVTLGLGSADVRAHVLDLSCTGALAHCETPPKAGSYVSVKGTGLETSGRVMWAKGKRFGIQFSVPLTEMETEELLRGA